MKHLKKFNENYLSMHFQNNQKLEITGEIKSTLISIFKEIGIPSYDELQSTISEKKSNIQSLIDDYNYQLPERFEIKMEELRYSNEVYDYLEIFERYKKFKTSRISSGVPYRRDGWFRLVLKENDMRIYLNNLTKKEYDSLDVDNRNILNKVYNDLRMNLLNQYYCEIEAYHFLQIPINYDIFHQYPKSYHVFNILDSFVFYKINKNSFEIISSNFSDVLDIKGFNSDKTTFSRYIYDVLRPLEKLNITMSYSGDSKTIMIYLYNKSEFLDELKRNSK
jgi:hypothetical protein